MIPTLKEYENRILEQYEVQRIKPLLEQVGWNEITFKYFTTINYHYKETDWKKVIQDNARIRRVVRSAFKSNIRMWFFIERHTDPEQKLYGGYHKHILIESIPSQRWFEPSNTMKSFMAVMDVEMLFGCVNRVMPTPQQQIKLLNKVIRDLCGKVPNGHLSMRTEHITNIEGCLAYCSKQFGMYKFGQLHKWCDVLDPKNSDIDSEHLLDYYEKKSAYAKVA